MLGLEKCTCAGSELAFYLAKRRMSAYLRWDGVRPLANQFA